MINYKYEEGGHNFWKSFDKIKGIIDESFIRSRATKKGLWNLEKKESVLPGAAKVRKQHSGQFCKAFITECAWAMPLALPHNTNYTQETRVWRSSAQRRVFQFNNR